MGLEDFYLELVSRMIKDENLSLLKIAVADGDVRRAFDAAHSLKGSLGNLELLPLERPVREITERLRYADEMPDLTELMNEYDGALEELTELCK